MTRLRSATGPGGRHHLVPGHRGQMNLICDVAGLSGDDYGNLIAAVITHRQSVQAALALIARRELPAAPLVTPELRLDQDLMADRGRAQGPLRRTRHSVRHQAGRSWSALAPRPGPRGSRYELRDLPATGQAIRLAGEALPGGRTT